MMLISNIKKNKIIQLCILILLVAIIYFIVYFVHQKNILSSQISKNKYSANPTTFPTAFPSVTVPAHWNSYTNGIWEYTIKYPSILYLVVAANPNDTSLIYIKTTTQPHIPTPDIAEINCSTNPNKYDAKTWW